MLDPANEYFHIAGMKFLAIASWVFLQLLLLNACASSMPDSGGNPAGGRGESAPCADCRSDEPLALKYTDSHAYREWGIPQLRMDSGTALGILPVLRLRASGPEECSICHSFSADAVEFDFSSAQDSLLRAVFANQQLEWLFPGMQVPERDSLLWRAWCDSLAQTPFADGKALADLSPWQERQGEAVYTRPVPAPLRTLLGRLGARYAVRYLVVPLVLNAELQPGSGKRGGYRWQSLWALWDARDGNLLLLDYRSFVAATSGTAPPDRHWSAPWASDLGKALQQGPRADETH